MIARLLGPSAVVLLTLASCGGGGGAGGGDDGSPPPPAASVQQILIDPKDEDDLDEIEAETGGRVIGPVEGTSYWIIEVPAGHDLDEFLGEMEEDDRLEDSDEDEGTQFPEGGLSTIPLFGDDPLASVATQPALQTIEAALAHTRATGQGVLVAIVDTGIVATHPAVLGHVAAGGWDYVDGDADPTDEANGDDDDGDGRIDEGVGHGTFVASLVLAVAPDAQILPIRVLNSDAVGTASALANGIALAANRGAHVINVSAGVVRSLTVLQQAVQYARSQGSAVFAAAGNRQSNVDYPAMYSDCEAVTGVEGDGLKASFASYGSAVDLCAPATDVIGAHPLSPSGTARWSGTSFATAFATGGFALLREAFPAESAEALRQRLEETSVSVDLQNPPFAGRLGHGRIALGAATAP